MADSLSHRLETVLRSYPTSHQLEMYLGIPGPIHQRSISVWAFTIHLGLRPDRQPRPALAVSKDIDASALLGH